MSECVILDEPRYEVHAFVDNFPHAGSHYNNVLLILFNAAAHREDLLEWAAGEYFTAEETGALTGWLLRIFSANLRDLHIQPVRGMAIDAKPIGMVQLEGPQSFYALNRHERYDLPFQVWGYYRMDVDHVEKVDGGMTNAG